MTKFYNYDTRGASAASQIITLERMLARAEEQRAILAEALQSIARNATTVGADAWCGDIARAALEEIKESE